MIVAEVSIIPIGTSSTSISDYVVESEKVLKNHSEISYKLTGMATEIEATNIDTLLNVIKEMHNAQINKGAKRVQTSLRIDDRRDKETDLNRKISSVQSKL